MKKILIKKIFYHSVIFFIAIITTIIFTWPFLTKLTSYYLDESDYALNGWILWYNQDSLRSGRIFNLTEYFNAPQFYGFPFTLAYSENMLLPSLAFSLIYWMTNNQVLSVNLFTFSIMLISFMSCFYVVKALTKTMDSALIGSILFTFNPITFFFFPDGIQMLNRYFIPPLFLSLLIFLKTPTIKKAFLLAFLFLLNAFSSIYYQIFALITIPLISFPFFVYQVYKKNISYFFTIIKSLPILLFLLPILLYINFPYYQFSNKEQVNRSLMETSHYSARLWDWFSPSPISKIYKSLSNEFIKYRNPKDQNGSFNFSEHSLFVGIIPTILFLLAIFKILKSYRKNPARETIYMHIFFMLLLLLSFIFAFGPYFFGWNESESTIRLPYYYLYSLLTPIRGIRVPTRIQFIFYLPFSIFIAWGINLFSKKQIVRGILVTIIFLGLLYEYRYYTPYETKSTSETVYNKYNYIQNPYFKFLENQPTLHYPIYAPENNWGELKYLSFATLTGERILNGYSGYFPSDWTELMLKIKTSLNEDALKILKALRIKYIIIHKDFINEKTGEVFDGQNKNFAKGKIYSDDKLIIIDLSKFDINLEYCIENEDFEYFIDSSISNNTSSFYIHNKHNCYAVNQFEKRYVDIQYISGTKKFTANFRLPIIIYPHEEIKINLPKINRMIEDQAIEVRIGRFNFSSILGTTTKL